MSSALSRPMRHPLFLASLILCALPGACAKKSQDAVVIGKEFVAAENSGNLPPGEVLKDARAVDHDLWLVKIQMTNGRKVDAPVEKAEWTR